MIQRAQSVYLLLITVVMSFLLVMPYAEITLASDQLLIFRAHAIISQSGNEVMDLFKITIPVIALVLITSLVSFINIFLYHRRIIQIRLCLLNTGLLAILLVIMFVYYISVRNSLITVHHAFRIPAIFPMMSIVFNLMAARAIQSDEMLVKSYHRLR